MEMEQDVFQEAGEGELPPTLQPPWLEPVTAAAEDRSGEQNQEQS